MTLSSSGLLPLVEAYLARQRWYQHARRGASGPLELVAMDLLREPVPQLYRLICRRGGHHFQVLVGARPSDGAGVMMRNEEAALIGALRDGEHESIVFDALYDDELALELLALTTNNSERARRVRLVASLHSHAALVYDDRLFMKCYRVLEPTPRPEIETLLSLDRVGFNALLAPVGVLAASGFDLCLVREFLPSALEARELALTSLRDVLAHAARPGSTSKRFAPVVDEPSADAVVKGSGGDLYSEMVRLGATTARLHLALEAAFSSRRLEQHELRAETASLDHLRPEADLGSAIRLNGDYHLRRVMRSETGWVVSGFSDDPLLSSQDDGSLPPHFGSPLEDVADMFVSLRALANEALAQRPKGELVPAGYLARAWTWRSEAGFLEGYLEDPRIGRLLPGTEAVRDALLRAFVARRS